MTMITPSYLGETIEYSSLHACRSTLEDPTGVLTTQPPAADGGSDWYDYDPADATPFLWSRDLDSGGPDDYRGIEARNDVLVYTTESPSAPMTICGPIRVTVVASSSARDTDWLARLSLVHRHGYSQRLAEGWVRARARHGEFRNDPLTPGHPETYDIDLWGTCVTVEPGERLRLAIMSGGFPLLTRNLNTGGPIGSDTTGVVAHQEVCHDEMRASYVTLPVVESPHYISTPSPREAPSVGPSAPSPTSRRSP